MERRWEAARTDERRRSGVIDLAFAGNSDRMASLGDGVVQVWDPGARSRLAMRPPMEADDEVPNVVKNIVGVDMSADERHVAWIANPSGSYRSEDERFADGQSVALWDLSSSTLTTFAGSPQLCDVGFLDVDLVVTGTEECSDDSTTEAWGVNGQALRRPVECVSGGLGSWAEPSRVVSSVVDSGTSVEICDEGQLLEVDLADSASALDSPDEEFAVDIAYDGSVAALLGGTNELVIARLERGSAVDSLQIDVPLPDPFSTGLATYVSPNGATVVVTSVQPDPTQSTTGRLLATLWDADSGRQLGTIGPAAIDDLAFTADGDMLAVAFSGGDIEIRDGRTLQLMTVLPGEGNGRLRVVEFSLDGTTLAEAWTGGGLALWDLDVRRWTRRACGIANRDLTREEIRIYYGELEPRTTVCDAATPEDAEAPPPRTILTDAATDTAVSRPGGPTDDEPPSTATSPVNLDPPAHVG